jgi:hypothetical protein
MVMLGWIVLAVIGIGAAVGAVLLPARWGRGAIGGRHNNPLDEIQDSTPRRGWP